MKLAVTDACIFIDIYELELSSEFFSLEIEIHTSLDVFNELHPHQKELLKAYQRIGKFTTHILTEEDRLEIYKCNYPKSLSDNDKTVLHLAEKIDAMVLSSDKAVRIYAKKKSIEYHGMLWIFDKLIDAKLIDPLTASDKLKKLIHSNTVYQNNGELVTEMNKRLKIWSNN
jgi:rRNA-processing protein FCF1